eukprot:2745958-Amphidinium_carterae.1
MNEHIMQITAAMLTDVVAKLNVSKKGIIKKIPKRFLNTWVTRCDEFSCRSLTRGSLVSRPPTPDLPEQTPHSNSQTRVLVRNEESERKREYAS